jgi:hypothetical protein
MGLSLYHVISFRASRHACTFVALMACQIRRLPNKEARIKEGVLQKKIVRNAASFLMFLCLRMYVHFVGLLHGNKSIPLCLTRSQKGVHIRLVDKETGSLGERYPLLHARAQCTQVRVSSGFRA